MARIRFENGTVVNFEGTPTQQDVEEVARSIGIGAVQPVPTQQGVSSSPAFTDQLSQQTSQVPTVDVFSGLSQAQPKKSFDEKAGGFLDFLFGGKKIGEAIGTGIAKGTFGTGIQKFVTGRDMPKEEEALVGSGPTKTQLAGDVARIGLNFLPGIGKGAGLAGRLATGAGIGTAFTGAELVRQGEQVTPGKLAFGAVVGAVAPEVVGYVGKKLARAVQSGSERIVESAFRREGKLLKKDIRVSDKLVRLKSEELPIFQKLVEDVHNSQAFKIGAEEQKMIFQKNIFGMRSDRLNAKFAQGRIKDIALKMDRAFPRLGLGDTFKDSINVKNTTLNELQHKSTELLNNFKETGLAIPTFAQKYLKDGVFFSGQKAARAKIQNEIIPDLNRKFDTIAASPVGDRKVLIGDLKPTLERSLKDLELVMGEDSAPIKLITSKVKQNLNWRDALALKRAINNVKLPPAAFADGRITIANQNLKNAAGKIAERLEERAADTEFKDVNKAYSLFITAYDGLLKRSTEKRSIGFFEKAAATGGVLAAPFSGGTSLGVAGGGILAERTARTLPVQLGTAFGIQKIKRGIQSPAARIAARQQFFNLLSKSRNSNQRP